MQVLAHFEMTFGKGGVAKSCANQAEVAQRMRLAAGFIYSKKAHRSRCTHDGVSRCLEAPQAVLCTGLEVMALGGSV